jgi:hypothetical protein
MLGYGFAHGKLHVQFAAPAHKKKWLAAGIA